MYYMSKCRLPFEIKKAFCCSHQRVNIHSEGSSDSRILKHSNTKYLQGLYRMKQSSAFIHEGQCGSLCDEV